jgi:hypothetical protein
MLEKPSVLLLENATFLGNYFDFSPAATIISMAQTEPLIEIPTASHCQAA